MMQTFENQQPSLFEFVEEASRIALAPAQKTQLAALVEALGLGRVGRGGGSAVADRRRQDRELGRRHGRAEGA